MNDNPPPSPTNTHGMYHPSLTTGKVQDGLGRKAADLIQYFTQLLSSYAVGQSVIHFSNHLSTLTPSLPFFSICLRFFFFFNGCHTTTNKLTLTLFLFLYPLVVIHPMP